MSDPAELRELFHTLNNQLGIILSHAELLEVKAKEDAQRARATLVVTTTLEALATTRQIRFALEPAAETPTPRSSDSDSTEDRTLPPDPGTTVR